MGHCEDSLCSDRASVYYHVEQNGRYGRLCQYHWDESFHSIQASVAGIRRITLEEFESLDLLAE
jgi:hypothetical protein